MYLIVSAGTVPESYRPASWEVAGHPFIKFFRHLFGYGSKAIPVFPGSIEEIDIASPGHSTLHPSFRMLFAN